MLNIGDKNDKIEVVDADRLCYRVHSRNKGAEGIRTISKDIVAEFVASLRENPNQNATELREKLTGSSQIDKFEYGYNSTIYALARIELEKNDTQREFTPHDQKIFFGAPGTGKSFKVNQLVGDSENVFRTTFHPDYDYAQFVGSYKPCQSPCEEKILDADNLQSKAKTFLTGDHDLLKFAALYSKSLSLVDEKQIIVNESPMKGEKNDRSISTQMSNGIAVGNFLKERIAKGSITYSFVPQVFAKAYAAAWKNLNQPVYLVIEEINRGNCAQIFGDLFQLLDCKNGESEYPINADADFGQWLVDEAKVPNHEYDENGCVKIKLPPNFNILATMNTSDQSLFPMDSAFKRRFDWEYVPIDFEGKDCASYQIRIDDENSYPWQKFVESVNEKIVSITDSEDKQLGEYFIKLNPVDNNVIAKERFLGKVMFYLWNEVCKDVHKQESFFREEGNGNYFTFQDLYKKDGDKKLISFMDWITK